ncbi:hypothetical protein HER10_EVM0011626 [Colletotrichum scovillei]|uniref:Uncharacterized protein n=1 Tax=Colletotrichum scovillei TaxID=1209932 RepID=A0A9P7QYS1_9PEZI|nr:uncharacterized protein HER10_EVM0011626 [Colletotrichum scovillei]KAF4781423.1 hypothetical protein HER10_EVM0011626 [Colletotrichum scovillei]KAG7045683.1 hypothetical protein JMJ77_0009761 [Colletotrichum scovillei]KAG7052843.1 hypothetical protein JMJ78_0005854 [Colletotrichum scovillei]KAG7065136.1 hypothetical protein JMJ76_0012888 [Colletotrichum scovillei]
MTDSYFESNIATTALKDQLRAVQAKNAPKKPEWASSQQNEQPVSTKGPRPLRLVEKYNKEKDDSSTNQNTPNPDTASAQEAEITAENPYCSGAIQDGLPIHMVDAENGQQLTEHPHHQNSEHLRTHEDVGTDHVTDRGRQLTEDGELPPIKTFWEKIESALYLYQLRTHGDNEEHPLYRARAKAFSMHKAVGILAAFSASLFFSVGIYFAKDDIQPPLNLPFMFTWIAISGIVVLWAIVAVILIQWSKRGLKHDLEVARMGDAFNATTVGDAGSEGCFVNGVRYEGEQRPRPDFVTNEAVQQENGLEASETSGSSTHSSLDVIRESKRNGAYNTKEELSKLPGTPE